jgi:hypothetical protein
LHELELTVSHIVGRALLPAEVPAKWRNVDYLTSMTVGPKVMEEVARALKTIVNTCTRPGTKNEVFMPEAWAVLNR